MINAFEKQLAGGHPNSLGNTIEVVDIVLADQPKLSDLYDCYSSEDEVVRLRVSSAFKRIAKAKPEWMIPYVDRFIDEVSCIEQPSAQWSFAQIMLQLNAFLTVTQRDKAIAALKRNLESSNDWIVLSTTMETLTSHAKNSDETREWLLPHLTKHAKDSRKSVARNAQKYLEQLQ